METQKGDSNPKLFSFFHKENNILPKQTFCYIAYTNKYTHSIIKDNIKKSAIYNGNIKGNGPRYCPSIEDKVVRFAEKDQHRIFIEPEGLNNAEMYPNGISTS